MKRRTFCRGLATAAAAAVLAPHAQATTAVDIVPLTVGHTVADGLYPLTYRSELSHSDVVHFFPYRESYFAHSAYEYDHELAFTTLGMALAAFNTAISDQQYWVDADVGRQENLVAAYETFGFGDTRFYHYDISVGHAADIVGYSLARKTLTAADGSRSTIVALMLRGGGYGGEWSSNLHVGIGDGHIGFTTPVSEVFTNLQAYLTAAERAGDLGTVKLWIGGYSRGSAVANLVAARIHNELTDIPSENVFVYTFATPVALRAGERKDLQQDYDNNHAADGTMKATWGKSNIFNIIASGDIVGRVMPKEWGYHRNGNDRFLPSTKNVAELEDLQTLANGLSEPVLDFSKLATAESTNKQVKALLATFVSKDEYCARYENALRDMVECAFLRSEEEVSYGAILDDEAIVERLLSLSNMKQFSWWTVVRAVWTASTMSRPILERFGTNVPLIAQQIIIPMLAVGICYGVDTDVVKDATSYIVQLVSSRGQSDDALRAAYCHEVENYICLMEYYAPSAHGMEPFTRQA